MKTEFSAKVLELTTIYEVGKVLTSTLDLRQSLDAVMNILDKFIEMKHGTVALYNPQTRELSTFIALGMKEEEKRLHTYRVGEGIAGKVFKSGSPMVIPDIREEPELGNYVRLEPKPRRTISCIYVPIKMRDKITGVLGVSFFREEVSFTMEEGLRVLTMVASLISQTIELANRVDREREKLLEEKNRLERELQIKYSLDNVVGQSDKMKEISETVHRVAATAATVFIRGESGTGKELIARAVHYNSPRASGPFVKLNCAALPDTLLESELFGHEKGSFTGASYERKGRFELADGGTIFLDEMGDIPVSTQMKLLRVLQEKKFERVGSSKTVSSDVRIIAATNKDIERAIAEGDFREDLYYRLNVIPIFLPPLRERKDDIPMLAEHFLHKFNGENQKSVRISAEVMDLMLRYSWPGNVRQLENCIQRLVIMADRDAISTEDMPLEIRTQNKTHSSPPHGEPAEWGEGEAPARKNPSSLIKTVEELEKERIISALHKCGWVKSHAATYLEITPRQLDYKVIKYGIKIRKPWQDLSGS
ncbi:MAG: nif-specific transcriptional activator NifA [Deltaproteobacteria bacterium]